MDGFAVNTADLPAREVRLPVSADMRTLGHLEAGTAVRIADGRLCQGANTVIPVGSQTIGAGTAPGRHCSGVAADPMCVAGST